MRRTRSYSGHMSVQMPMSLTESLSRIWPSGFMRPSLMNRSRSFGRAARIYGYQTSTWVCRCCEAYMFEALGVVILAKRRRIGSASEM